MEVLSDYERKRLENIRNNQKILDSLAIPLLPIAASVNKTSQNIKKAAPSAGNKRKKSERDSLEGEHGSPIRRTSARIQSKANGETSKLSMAEELELYRTTLRTREEKPKPKRVLGNIPFEPENGATEEFVSLMSSIALVKTRWERDLKPLDGGRHYRIDGEFSIAKVVQERIYSMAVHPNREKIIVSAGSKSGSLGIWDATAAWTGEAGSRETYHFRPHTAAISNQRYHPTNPGQLLMTSYDGIVRCLDIVKGEFSKLYCAKDEQYIAGFDVTNDGSALYFTDICGALTRLDPRCGKTSVFQLHEKKAGGFSLSPVDNNYCASSSLDDTICIWDVRKLKEYESDMLARFEYKRAVTSVFFHPQIRDALLSTCYDDSVRIHQGVLADNAQELRIPHNNQTGRWITPFRAIWDPKSTDLLHSRIVVGDMNRGVDVIEMDSGDLTNNVSELLTAQPAVNAIHSSLDLIVSGTASGKCILWKPSQ